MWQNFGAIRAAGLRPSSRLSELDRQCCKIVAKTKKASQGTPTNLLFYLVEPHGIEPWTS
jgi:hypothetical protein